MPRILHKLRKEPVLIIFFVLYCVLLFIGVGHHEPWADEAQAWLMARDSTLIGMVTHNLRYVGHPLLWYLLLMLPSRTMPYFALGYIGVFFAIMGIFVMYFFTSIPRIIKIVFSFSYFLFYQYALVARGYVVLPLLFFLVAILHKDRFKKPYLYLTVLSLIAMTSVHGTLVAVSIFGLNLLSLLRDKKKLKKDLIYSGIIFTAIILFVVYQIWPPKDLTFSSSYNFSPIRFIVFGTWIFMDAFSVSPILSAIFIFTSVVWFKLRNTLLYFLMPLLTVLLFFSVKYYNSWHQGILVLIWMFAYIISLKTEVNKKDVQVERYIHKAFNILIVLIFSIQIYWSASAFRSDFAFNYSAGKDTANYLIKSNLQDKKIFAVGYWTTSVLPYFNRNIFINGSSGDGSYWQWSPEVDSNPTVRDAVAYDPDVILVSRPRVDLTISGYKLKTIIKGSIFWKSGIKENNNIAIFLKEGP